MKKRTQILFTSALLILSMLFFVSCGSDDTSSQNVSTGQEDSSQSDDSNEADDQETPAGQDDGAESGNSNLVYDKEMFTFEDDGITYKLGMTIGELEAQGLTLPDNEGFELENVLAFFDGAGKIDDLSAYEGVKMSGVFNFSMNRDDIIALFSIDAEKEYTGADPAALTVYLRDKDATSYERVVVLRENGGSVPNDVLLLDIKFFEGAEMLVFNLYYPE